MKELYRAMTASNIDVIIADESHTHGMSRGIIMDAIGMITSNMPKEGRRSICAHFDMGGIVGKDALCDVTASNKTIMYHRPNGSNRRSTVSRMVLDAEAPDTTELTVVIGQPDEDGDVYLYTIYAGRQGELQPGDPQLDTPEKKANAEAFWACHALIPTAEERAEIEAGIGLA